MGRAAIVSGVRTPIGRATKAYAGVHAGDLLAVSLRGAVEASGVDPERVDVVLAGCTAQLGEQGGNVARNAWLAAGYPFTVPGTTVDAQCGSSQQTVNIAAALVMSGQAEVVLAGGVEALSRIPMGIEVVQGTAEIPVSPYSPAQQARFTMPHQGVAGERIARRYGVTREESDAWGVRSHVRADEAWERGHFKDEAVFVEHDAIPILQRDEGIRGDSTPERLAGLKPVYEEDGIITAGSASQLSDGSAAVLVASESAVGRLGLEPLAWVRRTTTVGVDPELMLEGPIVATSRLLEAEGLRLDDIDVFEVHEAYATVVCAWLRTHRVDPERVNLDGGAIGQGHPFGASGARQIAHLVHTLRRTGGRLGMQVMCCGGGLGTGTILEVA